MGADVFMVQASGNTPREAFNQACEDAFYMHGHGGYSGTIAEKDSYVLIPLPEDKDPMEYADELIDNEDRRVDDKWGPAGCIKIEDGQYLFFGWASS